MSRLSAASLRINASLDLDTVLGEVIEGSRVLTGSHGGLITTVDDSVHPRGLVSTGWLAVDITTVLGPAPSLRSRGGRFSAWLGRRSARWRGCPHAIRFVALRRVKG